MTQIVIGNDFELGVRLTKSGEDRIKKPFSISPQTLITATVVNPTRSVRYFDETVVSLVTPGTDLSQSLIIVRFAKAETALINKQGPAKIKIDLTENEGLGFKHPSWFIDVSAF
jgi:hypothetical protein